MPESGECPATPSQMLLKKRITGCFCLVAAVVSVGSFISWRCAGYFLIVLILLEIFVFLFVHYLRSKFQWLITPRDFYPVLDKLGLKKFIQHGYDPELGWVRKPCTVGEEWGKDGKTRYSIDEFGSRCDPSHEGWPQAISFYGDSFTFGRQVNDNETFTWHLAERTKTHVLNFAVGNYGLDQALLRLKREYPRYRTPIVILGLVPSTIVRVLSVWKHYNEFGNTFGFKPRYVVRQGSLKLVKNFMDREDKFLSYRQYLSDIQKCDPMYELKFKKDMLCFPYLTSILADPRRNIPLLLLVSWDRWFGKVDKSQPYPMPMNVIMKSNLRLRRELFSRRREAIDLMEKLVADFAAYGKREGFVPVLLWIPQKDDLAYIAKHGNYCADFLEYVRKEMILIDLTDGLLSRDDRDEMYSDDNQYGGHLSRQGNEWAAEVIYGALNEMGFMKSLTIAKKERE